MHWNPCKHHQEQIFCLLVLFGVFFLISCLSCFKVLSRLSYSHGPFCTSSFVQACFIVIIMNIVLLYQHCIVLHCIGHFNVLLSDVSPPCQRLFLSMMNIVLPNEHNISISMYFYRTLLLLVRDCFIYDEYSSTK